MEPRLKLTVCLLSRYRRTLSLSRSLFWKKSPSRCKDTLACNNQTN